ncbi:hypothetical protein SteCoe_35402 [Stentor coeruleus]|uniref:Uncharacterized protein n=1 Tax=Stentor coeruleus TaxID=5963 RepID=A0A1R2ASE5_9CILI|nr:hypothetical protein SteCoe_35402 [Stentor coeruleus]
MFLFLIRRFGKKVRIPSANVKQNLTVPIPDKKFLDQSEFSQLSQNYLYKAKVALENIHKSNEGSVLEIQPSLIRFETNIFKLLIERNFHEQCMQVMVGNGITYNYFYDTESERWISDRDGHLLDELLCREISYKCQGFFNI